MLGYWKRQYDMLYKKYCSWVDQNNTLTIIKSEVAKLESYAGAYKIENEALKEQIVNLKKVINEKDGIIENLVQVYDRFHGDFMDVCADNFPVFPHDEA